MATLLTTHSWLPLLSLHLSGTVLNCTVWRELGLWAGPFPTWALLLLSPQPLCKGRWGRSGMGQVVPLGCLLWESKAHKGCAEMPFFFFWQINVLFCYWINGWNRGTFLFAALCVAVLFCPLNCALTFLKKRSLQLLVPLLKSKNWGETACSQLSYMHLTELTSISCNSSSYLCWDKKGRPSW